MDSYKRAYLIQTKIIDELVAERDLQREQLRRWRFKFYGAICGAIIGGMICAYIK